MTSAIKAWSAIAYFAVGLRTWVKYFGHQLICACATWIWFDGRLATSATAWRNYDVMSPETGGFIYAQISPYFVRLAGQSSEMQCRLCCIVVSYFSSSELTACLDLNWNFRPKFFWVRRTQWTIFSRCFRIHCCQEVGACDYRLATDCLQGCACLQWLKWLCQAGGLRGRRRHILCTK